VLQPNYLNPAFVRPKNCVKKMIFPTKQGKPPPPKENTAHFSPTGGGYWYKVGGSIAGPRSSRRSQPLGNSSLFLLLQTIVRSLPSYFFREDTLLLPWVNDWNHVLHRDFILHFPNYSPVQKSVLPLSLSPGLVADNCLWAPPNFQDPQQHFFFFCGGGGGGVLFLKRIHRSLELVGVVVWLRYF